MNGRCPIVVSPPGEDQVCWQGSGVLVSIFSAGKGQECCSGSGVLTSIFSTGKSQECCFGSGVLARVRCAGEYLFCWQGSEVLWVRCAALGHVLLQVGRGAVGKTDFVATLAI